MAERDLGSARRARRLRRPRRSARHRRGGRGHAVALSRAGDGPAPLGIRGLLPQRVDAGAARVRDVAHAAGARGAAVRHRELRRGEPLDGRRRAGGFGGDAGRGVRVGGGVRREELPPRAEEAHQAAIVPVAQRPGAQLMGDEKQDFLRRWSRLKRESAAQKPVVQDPAPQLPPLDSLTFESDFKAFMHSKVEEGVKRAALKKLFSDPRFNVMDGLDTYIDDYTKAEPVTEELLARLEHARQTLLAPPPEQKEETAAKEQPKDDVDKRQDA